MLLYLIQNESFISYCLNHILSLFSIRGGMQSSCAVHIGRITISLRISSSGILLSCTSCIGGTIHLLSCASRVGRTTHYCLVHLRGEIICSVSVHLEGPISYCCMITWAGSFTVVLCTSCRWYRLHLSFVSCIHCWDHLLRSCFSRTGALVCYRLMHLIGHARHVHLSGLLHHCLIHPTKFEAYAIVLCTLYMCNHLLIVLCISGWCLHKQLSFISRISGITCCYLV